MDLILTIIVILFVFLVINGGFVWLIMRKKNVGKSEQGVLMLQQQIQDYVREMAERQGL
ncbi:MAG: hypothetical protein IH857_03050, partial [Deltaproteobacteria bacterium]|nr:hypothetical protein [Deltaproteobacteria bacterium]